MNISVVIPLYNEQESISELVAWIAKVMYDNNFTYEIIVVDDGSTDGSWDEIHKLTEEYGSIRAIRFRRNYGKSAALFCGFREAEGDVVFTMDADLQDSPDEIPAMYKMIVNDKFDMVSGWKKKRHDPITKTIPSKLYNWVGRVTTGIGLHDMNCGLKAYRRDVVKSIEVYGEMHRYIPVLAKQAGFCRIGEKVVEHRARKYGKTKFGIERFINGFLDLMSILFMTKFGKKPMHLFGTLGVFVFFLGFFAATTVGAIKLISLSRGIAAPLVTSSPYFYLALTCMILGTQLFLTGFLGELVSRSSNDRNDYQIKETL
ncbi:MAG: glycosyltransferase family 2 protein [Salinivirgaceae bacterium]|nr:glycosyltransferase family 2 protein [Salinivirgaceae bacterium]